MEAVTIAVTAAAMARARAELDAYRAAMRDAADRAAVLGVGVVMVTFPGEGTWIGPHPLVPAGHLYRFPQGMEPGVRKLWGL